MEDTGRTILHDYIERDEAYYSNYETYWTDLTLIEKVRKTLPVAHVLTVTRPNCPDCAKYVPGMARIANYLPEWTWELVLSENMERREELGVRYVPAFLIYDKPGGKELGRIVERPRSGALEQDLWNIVHAVES